MKRFIIMLCLLTVSAGCTTMQAANPRTMTFPPLTFEIPKAERVILECGMPVYLLRDTELPIINMTAMVKTGSVYEPAAKIGLAEMTGSLMRSGGAGGITAEKMDDELEFMASAVESGIGADMGTVSMTALKKNFQPTLQLFRAVLLQPDFNEKRIEISRQQIVEALRRQNDDPKDIAGRELGKAIYDGHPLGRHETFDTVTSITRKDMVEFHRRFYRQDNMILAVSGDFDRNEILASLNNLFSAGKLPAPIELPFVVQPVQQFKGEIIYGNKDVNQSVIRMGHLGLTKDSPDIYAVRMLDYILGGSFTSRLTMEVRTNQGLAYSVGSHFDIGRRFTGTFTAETETKAESTIKAVRLMKDIIAGMTTAPVTDAELTAAREYMINSFMFGFTNPATIVNQRARLEFYGYSDGYLEKYRDNIAKVTKDDILAAAKKYLHPDAFKLVVVGNESKFDAPLSTLGQVRQLDLKINIPKP